MKIIRYGFVALLAAAADMAALYVSTPILGLPYLSGTAVGFLAGLLVNYLLSIRFVFAGERHKEQKTSVEFAVYTLIGGIGLILSLLLMRLFVGTIGMPVMYAKAVTTGLVFFWNYFGRRTFYKRGGVRCKN